MARALELERGRTGETGCRDLCAGWVGLLRVPVDVVDGGRLDVCDARRQRVPECGAVADSGNDRLTLWSAA